MRASFRLRIRLITALVFLVAGIIVTRLYFVQIVHGEEYSAKADHQYVNAGGGELYDRGNIFFKDKEGRLISAATLKSGFLLAIKPDAIADSEPTYERLQSVIDIDRETFISRAEKKGDPYEEVANHIEKDTAERIEALDLKGVDLYRERWRYYPGGSLAAQTVGFVGFDEDGFSGRYGLERYYNDTLSRDGRGLYVNFFAEIFADLNVFVSPDKVGGDVVTTIEPSVQLFLERELEALAARWSARRTAGIIINPKTGSIYALGVYPDFDPNHYGDVEDPLVFGNPLVEGVYEMGSIIKPLTVAAGLDSKAITAQSTYYDAGKLTLDGYTISNFDGKGRGTVSMQEVLNQSLNTGVAHIVRQMGNTTFAEYMRAYKIGEETGIDLPGEVPGLVKNLESPRDIEFATASYGQGIAMTPIQTVRALSVLGNGGKLITPHVGDEIRLDSGLSKDISYPDGEQVISRETSEEITRMLVRVVDEALRGGEVTREHYSIAAKTGTAQIASPQGGYYDDRFLHSFFGYFPAYDPQFLIFLMTIEPIGVRYASETLTDPFMEIVDFLINYYEVPPDR